MKTTKNTTTTAKVAKKNTVKASAKNKTIVRRSKNTTHRITVLAKQNPHRGNLAIAFSLLKNNMTVQQYLEAIEKDKRLPLRSRAYLNYELLKKNIALKAA